MKRRARFGGWIACASMLGACGPAVPEDEAGSVASSDDAEIEVATVQDALTATLTSVADTTLYEDGGGLSAGTPNPAMIGRIGSTAEGCSGAECGFLRRTLVRFDLSSVPAGALVSKVTMTLSTLGGAAHDTVPRKVELHRMKNAWAESANGETGHTGSAALTGDPTWTHRSFPSATWTAGGSFLGVSASATAPIPMGLGSPGTLTFTSVGLVADVEAWLAGTVNGGWLVKLATTDEVPTRTIRRINTREGGAGTAPTLVVNYVVPAWGTAAVIDAGTGAVATPAVGMDTSGNAIAVWIQTPASGPKQVIASRYVRSSNTWGAPIRIDTGVAGLGGSVPRIAVNRTGSALAVWQQHDGSTTHIWAARFLTTTGWQAPQQLETAGGAKTPDVAIDSSGNAMAVWFQSAASLGTQKYWAARFLAASGWQSAVAIAASSATGDAPVVGVAPNGTAFAVWAQKTTTKKNLWGNRFTATAGWGTEVLLETDDTGNVGTLSGPDVAVDASAHATVVWQQTDAAANSFVYAARYVSSWSAPVVLSGGASAREPQVAVDGSNRLIAAWTPVDGVWARRFVSSWGMAIQLDADGDLPTIGMDTPGNAEAVWRRKTASTFSMQSRRYAAGSGWSGSTLAVSPSFTAGGGGSVAVNPAGEGVAVWPANASSGGVQDTWANQFH